MEGRPPGRVPCPEADQLRLTLVIQNQDSEERQEPDERDIKRRRLRFPGCSFGKTHQGEHVTQKEVQGKGYRP